MFVFTQKGGGAAGFGLKISSSCSTTISSENEILDCLSNWCARFFCTGVTLYNLEIFCLAQT